MTNTELTRIRESLDMSKTEFALKIGISPVMEGKYEKGSREIPEDVIREVYALMEGAKAEPVVVETAVGEETATPVAEKDPVADAERIVEEMATPAGEEVGTSAGEEASVADAERIVEEKSVIEKDPAMIVNTTEPLSALPFILPLIMPPVLLGMGFIMRPRRWRIFGPWL